MALTYAISIVNWIFWKFLSEIIFLLFFMDFLIIDVLLQYCETFWNFEQVKLVENLHPKYPPYFA